MPIAFSADTFLEGEFAQTSCVLRKGDKPIQFSWLFEDQPLFDTEYIKIGRMGSRSSILTIDPVKGFNRGNYTCVALNKAGRGSVHTLLKVNGTCINNMCNSMLLHRLWESNSALLDKQLSCILC